MVSNLKYDVQLLLATSNSSNFWGTVIISFDLSELPTEDSPLKLSSKVNIHTFTVNSIQFKLTDTRSSHILLPADTLTLGINCVTVDYEAAYTPAGDDAVGMYRENDASGRLELAYTQCEPDFAKQIFPVFEVLRFKANYRLTLIVSKDLQVITMETPDISKDASSIEDVADLVSSSLAEKLNTLTKPSDSESDYQIFRSLWTLPISFNLFAFAVGNWHKIEAENFNGKPVAFYCVKDKRNLLDACISRLKNLVKYGLEFFEDYFGHEMAYSKYEQVFIPNFSFNGMENPGCIFLNDKNLAYPESIWEVFNRDRLLMHEMAHMWMGNLVTMDEFHNIWLKEAVVEYLCHKCLEHIIPQVNPLITSEEVFVNFVFRTNFVTRTEKPPFVSSSYPLCFRCQPYHDDIKEYYGSIVYQKGSSFIRGLDLMLGGNIFRDAIRSVIQKFKEKNYDHDQFRGVIIDTILETQGQESFDSSAESRKEKFNKWFEDHVHTKGYTMLKVNNFQYDNKDKAVKISITANHAKFYDITFRAYGFNGELLREFKFNPKAKQAEDISEHLFVQHEIPSPVAAIVPNTTYGSFMVVQLDNQSLASLFNKIRPLIHDLSMLERAVVYQSYTGNPHPADLRTLVHASAIVDDSVYINELYGIRTKAWNNIAWKLNMVKQTEMN